MLPTASVKSFVNKPHLTSTPFRGYWSAQSAIVCGASSGLGLAIAEQLALQVARLVLVARGTEKLSAVAARLQQTTPTVEVHTIACDVSTSIGAAELARQLESLGGDFHLLVNAVGQSDRGVVLALTLERLGELIHANVSSALLATQTVVPRMPAGSVIVNIGSLSSRFAPRFLGGYSIAKHGVAALTQQSRLELAERGIHVMLVCPGPIASKSTESRYAKLDTAGSLPPSALKGGAGAKLKGLDPQQLSADILAAAARRKIELVRPRKAKLLIWIAALWPSLGDRLLRRLTS